MKKLPIATIKNLNTGIFLITYVDGSTEDIQRHEMMFALTNNYLSQAEATAFKYADCIPHEAQKAT